ncbi:MAG: hypothetical protein EOP60_02550 [Sphingomonadales bacterium]|nr:MAG: hypothetical protein EOP60_02550 [Sphingomonadales bacterium]
MRLWILASTLALAACGGEVLPPARSAGYVPVPSNAPPPPPSVSAIGGQNAARLIAQFGKPHLDMTEGTARKLQFAGPICVLDAYLYPKGRNEPVVTYIDTRQRNGGPIDQASCVAALAKRP